MKKLTKPMSALLAAILCAANFFMPVEAKETWPKMPKIEAPSICVMEISTGTILFERDMDEVNYPASITKIMTALLAIENTKLDEIVTFSQDAVYKNEGDTSHISRDIGEEMTMEECLYGMMLESANECAWAIGEHIGGTMENFAKMMNDRAESLGCTNTHFQNPNGLPDEDHWTSAHDMALIAAEAYRNETFRILAGTKSYTIPPTNKHVDETPLHNHHKMLYPWRGDSTYLYDFCTGGKTGYTNAAGNTPVTYAEKDDMPLVCVVMREKTPYHYTDTQEIFDYCFEHFKLLRVADYETDDPTDQNREPFAGIDENAMVVVPSGVSFSKLKSEIVYDNADEDVLGTIEYSYANHVVGRADVRMNDIELDSYQFTENVRTEVNTSGSESDETEGEGEQEKELESEPKDVKKELRSINIEINARMIGIAAGALFIIILLILLLRWVFTYSYVFRQKLAMMRSRRSERNRYRTIYDTRKSRRRGKRKKKSKDLRF